MDEHYHQGEWQLITGCSLIGFSFIPFILVFIVPFLGFTIAKSTIIIGFLIIIAEISFYLGIALVGKSLFHHKKDKIKDLLLLRFLQRKYVITKTRYLFSLVTFYISIFLFLTAAIIPFIHAGKERDYIFLAIIFTGLVLLVSSLFFFKEKRRSILKQNNHK